MQTAAAAVQCPLISQSPSFNAYSSSERLAQIAARVVSELTLHDKHLAQDSDWEDLYGYRQQQEQVPKQPQPPDGGGTEAEEEFEFAVVPREPYTCPISADEIFANGQIRPVYPLFNQELLLDHHSDVVSPTNDDGPTDSAQNATNAAPPKQRRLPLRMLMIEEERETASCSSSEADDLENLPPGTYCVWAPPKSASGRRGGKSGSAGSSKRWKLRNLLYRSSSGGKDTFVILAPSVVAKKGDDHITNMKGDDVVRKRVGAGGGGGEEEGEKRRSFLPVKQDFVGFFSNVNGLSRNLHPF